MTPSQLEHLRLLLAHLDKLLDIAAKRTPGEWKDSPNYLIGGWWVQTPFNEVAETSTADFCNEHDATFIASCAGNAEAGWRATKAAVEFLLLQAEVGEGSRFGHLLTDILSAWPIELLQA